LTCGFYYVSRSLHLRLSHGPLHFLRITRHTNPLPSYESEQIVALYHCDDKGARADQIVGAQVVAYVRRAASHSAPVVCASADERQPSIDSGASTSSPRICRSRQGMIVGGKHLAVESGDERHGLFKYQHLGEFVGGYAGDRGRRETAIALLRTRPADP
jgi:hypothetical protein